MTETQAPPADEQATAPAADGQTAAPATEETTPKSLRDLFVKSLARGYSDKNVPDNTKHLEFTKWIKSNSGENFQLPGVDGVEAEGWDLDYPTIIACQSLYNVWRKTDEFKALDERLKAEGPKARPEPTPKTPEEAKAALEKEIKRQESLARQAKVAQERIARAQARVAELQGQATAEATPAAETPAPSGDSAPAEPTAGAHEAPAVDESMEEVF